MFNYIPASEVEKEKQREIARNQLKNSANIERIIANLDYIAMMTDTELEEVEVNE